MDETKEFDDSESEWSDEPDSNCRGLFSDQTFNTTQQALQNAREEFGFDFDHFRRHFELDFYGCVRLLNYIRYQIIVIKNKPENVVESLSQCVNETDEIDENPPFMDDLFLRPVLSDDTLLMSFDMGSEDEFDDDEEPQENGIPRATDDDELKEIVDDDESLAVRRLRHENEMLKQQLAEMQLLLSIPSEEKKESGPLGRDTDYFGSYSMTTIHKVMLLDEVRTGAYQRFIEESGRSVFENKIVMDLGCGTGVLSIFAARAGATHVYAIDAADIIDIAREIIDRNGFSDKITCVKGKIEEISLDCEIDIVVSEWMGYLLLYESMLTSIIYARDNLLKPGDGSPRCFPSQASLHCFGLNYHEMCSSKFKNLYGIDFTPIVHGRRYTKCSEGQTEVIDPRFVCTDLVKIHTFDIESVRDEDLDFTTEFDLTLKEEMFDDAYVGVLDAIGFYFDTCSPDLTTSPEFPKTHWEQTFVVLPATLRLARHSVVQVKANFARKEDERRQYDLYIEVACDGDVVVRKVYDI